MRPSTLRRKTFEMPCLRSPLALGEGRIYSTISPKSVADELPVTRTRMNSPG